MARSETLLIAGPAGRLEAVLMHPEADPVAAAVICHADPRQGGVMHFKTVFRIAKALQEEGLAVLRFNFRGVGLSEGVHDDGRGEQGDASAALDEVARRFPAIPLLVGGFSFGSIVACLVASRQRRVKALLLAGFPLSRTSSKACLSSVGVPRLFVQGELDAFGDGDALRALVGSLPEPRSLTVVAGADHFFTDKLDDLKEAVMAWARARPWEAN